MLSPDVESILKIQQNRSFREEKLKEKMLKTVKEKIQNYANFSQTNCIYTIPNFLFGEIPYCLKSMNKYLVKKLKHEGFYIINLSIQYLYISWDIKDINIAIEEKNKKVKNKLRKNTENSNNTSNFSAFANNDKRTF